MVQILGSCCKKVKYKVITSKFQFVQNLFLSYQMFCVIRVSKMSGIQIFGRKFVRDCIMNLRLLLCMCLLLDLHFLHMKLLLVHITYILYQLWTNNSYFLGNIPEKGGWSKNVLILKKLCSGSYIPGSRLLETLVHE